MTHISDLLASGQASDKVIGKGLQIIGVKVNPDFTGVNVFWIAGEDQSKFLEDELSKCSGYIRHELSQLRIIGEVPRIYFLKDKAYAMSSEVDRILKNADFGTEEEDLEKIQNELSLHSIQKDDQIPEMRHDVLGLDHKEVLLNILTKLKKSKSAWEAHELGLNISEVIEEKEEKPTELPGVSEDFAKFMAMRQNRLKDEKKKWRDRTDYRKVLLEEEKDSNDHMPISNDGDYIEEDKDNSDFIK